ncbi:MAG: hypothetical protein ACPH5J_09405, partial [Candidatus Puniceispirillum sp.]
LADMNAYLEESLEGELLDNINAELAAISEVEGGLDALLTYTSLEDCLANGDRQVCLDTQAAMDRADAARGDDQDPAPPVDGVSELGEEG